MNRLLTRAATTYGGRNGVIRDTQSKTHLDLAKPIELGGIPQPGTNPEELFAMGYSACFASSLEYLLESASVDYESISVNVEIALEANPTTGFAFAATIRARVLGATPSIEQEYIQKAYQFCPYSKAIKGNVNVTFA
ncbi:MAG: Ohr family peroxiredoxin [Bacillus subtilis]|nr:Ohr family peroxiredoxin [Bacillus subtilis]